MDSWGGPFHFATTLETLAVKVFGDMGKTARLRIIRDRFIAGHDCCELRQHSDRQCVTGNPHPGYCGSLPGVGESRLIRHSEIQ